jgi:hypothetical protein
MSCHHEPRLKGVCDSSETVHCIDCCRAGCGSSGPGSDDWNWKLVEEYTAGALEMAAKFKAHVEETNKTIKVRVEHECKNCSGTGLYQGFGEQKDAAAVVCSYCKGTGQRVFEEQFTPFTGRKPKKGVKRVFQTNPGIAIGTAPGCVDPQTKEPLRLDHFGGIPYKDWAAGKGFPPGSEMRRFVCPAWWYQSADSTKRPEWKECGWGQIFSDCKHFKDKSKCWERFDKEQAEKQNVKKEK